MHTLTTCSFLNNIGQQPQSIDSPLQLKLIQFLGLKNYMIDNFIFRRKTSKYIIRKKDHRNCLFTSQQYQSPTGYNIEIKILQTSSNSVPILHLIPKYKINSTVIVYAHGNGSDMADSMNFIQRLSQCIKCQYVVFDYTGYGQSRVADVGQEVICKDLEIVLAWLTQIVKISDVILWGFSLGTYPVVYNAAKYPVSAVILQCPIASISCLFHKQLHPDMKFKQDHFANINYINQIKSRIMIIHSSADQIIPFSHAKLLYTKYMMKHGQQQIDFVQVGKVKHNSLHKYIVSNIQNDLQKEVFGFLTDVIYKNRNLNLFSFSLQQNGNNNYNQLGMEMINNQSNSARSISRTQKTQLPTQVQIPSQQNIQKPQQPQTQQNRMKSIKQLPINSYNTNGIINSQKKKYLQVQEQLKKLRMRIVYADIQEISGDMHQLVVTQDNQKQEKNVKDKSIQQKLFDEKIRKNCQFFTKQKN